MSGTEFPRTVDEITPEWLTRVLRESGAIDGARVESFSAAGLDGGLVGDVNRLELVYSADGDSSIPQTVIAKIAHSDDEKRGKHNSNGFYEREVRFYQNFNSDVGIATPFAYGAEYEEDSGYFILLLEDLGRYRSISQHDSCSLTEGKSAVQTLAKLHSKWWESDRIYESDWLRNFSDDEFLSGISDVYNNSLEKFLEIGDNYFAAGYESVARKFGESFLEVMGHFGKGPVTLMHGDFRLGNLLFDDREGATDPVYAFDWQLAGRGKGVIDLAYFVGWSFSNQDRQRHEKQLLADYYDSIIDLGVTNYSSEEFNVDVRVGAFRLMHIATLGIANMGQQMQETDEGNQFIKTLCNRLQFLVDWNCDEVIPK
jgi:hypothetical protein